MPVTFKRKIVKIGGSYRLTVPKEIVEAMNIVEGEELTIWLDEPKNIMLAKKT